MSMQPSMLAKTRDRKTERPIQTTAILTRVCGLGSICTSEKGVFTVGTREILAAKLVFGTQNQNSPAVLAASIRARGEKILFHSIRV